MLLHFYWNGLKIIKLTLKNGPKQNKLEFFGFQQVCMPKILRVKVQRMS